MDNSLLWTRWVDVDRLLDEALDLPHAQRAVFVEGRTVNDQELRDLVLRLLNRIEDDNERVTGPSEAVVLGAFSYDGEQSPPEDLSPGTRIGRYVIGERLGRGGMATVYRAERSDGVYRQQVAFKVLRRGLDTDDLIRRFLTERQILSSLAHSNIARLLDGGALDDGRPYLVMELVEGRTITAHADAARLDVRARIDLVLQVVDAIRAAHKRLVVHRDIKPSNILVDADGRAKLLDFGIAKLLETEDGLTESGARALTPDYASPEQLRGDAITTGSDIYQLGLLLRALLAGVAPLTGELQLVIGKALRADPEERYATADDLATDLRNVLERRPIQAHPESALYRVRKFASRHPLFAPIAIVSALALVVFITTLELQNRRIEQQRDVAEAASRRALATQQFLVELLRSADPSSGSGGAGGRDITVVQALQQGRARVASELRDQPEVRAAVLEAMGQTFSGLGRYETADSLLRESLDLTVAQFGNESPQAIDLIIRIAVNHRVARDFRLADSVFHDALGMRLRAGARGDSVLAGLLGELSLTRRELGDIDSAIALADRAVGARRSTGDTLGDRYTASLSSLALVLRTANHLDSAERVYREVLRRQTRATTPNPLAMAATYNNLAYLLKTRNEFSAAEESYRQAIRLAKETLGDGHATTLMYTSNLVGALEPQGKLDEVVEIGRRRIAAAEAEWPQGHWRVGSTHISLARFLLRHGRAGEALPFMEAAVRSYSETLGAGHTWTVQAQSDLAVLLLVLGRHAEGSALFDRSMDALRAQREQLDADHRFNIQRAATLLETNGLAAHAAQLRGLLPADNR